jgi:hypothetical protein
MFGSQVTNSPPEVPTELTAQLNQVGRKACMKFLAFSEWTKVS